MEVNNAEKTIIYRLWQQHKFGTDGVSMSAFESCWNIGNKGL